MDCAASAVAGVGEGEPQICSVVDHPKLEHQWLWNIFSSKVRTNVGIDDMFDEEEDLPEPPPRQVIVNPENFIDIPEPTYDDSGEFDIDISPISDEPRKDWQEVLEGIVYHPETVTITDQTISGVERHALTGDGWRTLESAPQDVNGVPIPVDIDDVADAIKEGLLLMSERLLENAGHTTQFKGKIYSILLNHIRTKFLDGASMGLAEETHIATTWRMLPEVEKQIGGVPGLVEGMVKYGDK